MEHLDFFTAIDHPEKLEEVEISDLQKILKEYPYFQAAHVLILRAMKLQKNSGYDQQLSFSSIHVPHREFLYYLLNRESSGADTQTAAEDLKESVTNAEEDTQQPGGQDHSTTPSPQKETTPDPSDEKLLKNKNVRRKIKDSIEGMGENISETILSQIEFSQVKEDDQLRYPPEIYFIDDERTGKNNIITIDARPGRISESLKNDIFQIDESEDISEAEDQQPPGKKNVDNKENQSPAEKKNKESPEYFDINQYADEDVIENSGDHDLIARFISEKPRIEPREVPDDQQDISEDSTRENDDLLTETLIKVYIAQGYLEKAIESYHKLSLKYPEKSSYFADQIKKLKEKLNS
ncbi:MAG: hypothetical protein V2I54_13345 [Bacteroidales bacterium]|jgi:hypothetical protein|nr:hypothetical protein [Bacteroidales bacterium]